MTLFLHPRALTPAFACHLPVEDPSALLEWHPNLLISGPREATHGFLLTLNPTLQLPIRRLVCDARLRFPAAGGTLILSDVDALDSRQQETLVSWLDDALTTQTQVISLTTAPLYTHVLAGAFLRTLYYRLNVIYFEVSPDERPKVENSAR